MATTAQSLLALYGALDQAVTGTGDAEIEATVERYLPGSTGENAGWYDQLLGFLGDRSHRVPEREFEEPPAVPDLSDALATLQELHGTTDGADRVRLTPVQSSRMVYAIGALSHLPSYYPPDEWDERFAQTLELARGGENLLDLLRRDFRRRDDFSTVMQFAAQHAWIDAYVALVPLCQTKVKFVRGHLCVVLTTEFESDQVSLDQLKDVIDLRNWANCLPFFCSMTPEKDRPDGWSRVLEHVSTTCSIPGTPQMVTPLKYWKGPAQGVVLPQPSAWVDYALDDDPAPGEVGDGRMVVDEGFIRMTSTVNNSSVDGVRVRTRKVAGFRDLAFVPAAIFACVMGYGDQGVEMLLGGVAKRPLGGSAAWTDWKPSTLPASQSGGASAQPTQTDGCDPGRTAVEVAVCMLNECIDDVSQQSAAIADKWATGAVPIAETMTFTTNLAARLATDPWRYLERLRDANRGSGK
jgi:hypothetical protein